MDRIEPLQRHPLHSTAAILEAALNDIENGKAQGRASQSPVAGRGALRPIIVYGLSDIRAACQAALELGQDSLAVLSPSGIAHSLGPQWFKHLLMSAKVTFSELKITGIMDCGPYEGYVMSTWGSGLRDAYFTGDDTTAEKLGWIAIRMNCMLHRGFSEALDMKTQADQLEACRGWFQSGLKNKTGFATQKA